MKILVTSIVDLKKSQQNFLRKNLVKPPALRLERPHQFVKYLSKKHEVTVLSINDWWKGSQDDLEDYSSEFEDVFKNIEYFYLTDKKISPILQELFFKRKIKEALKEDFDVHLNYSTLISGYFAAKRLKTVYDMADDLGAMIRESPQIPRLLRPFGGVLGDLMIRNKLRVPDDYADTFRVMEEVGFFSKDLVERLVKMAKFRNRLVHIYWAVDDEVIYEILRDDIKDIEEFVEAFMNVLREKGMAE